MSDSHHFPELSHDARRAAWQRSLGECCRVDSSTREARRFLARTSHLTPTMAELVHRQAAYWRDRLAPPAAHKAGRNDPCPCGSGVKHKKCCAAPVAA